MSGAELVAINFEWHGAKICGTRIEFVHEWKNTKPVVVFVSPAAW